MCKELSSRGRERSLSSRVSNDVVPDELPGRSVPLLFQLALMRLLLLRQSALVSLLLPLQLPLMRLLLLRLSELVVLALPLKEQLHRPAYETASAGYKESLANEIG